MSTKDNGGPAFPTDPNTQPGFYQHHGMSLRDWFAGQALGAFLHINNANYAGPIVFAEVAGVAYLQADAMLAERERSK